MFCSSCGSQIQDGSKVCPFCGQRIITNTTKGFAKGLLNMAADKIDAMQNSDLVADFKDRVVDKVEDIQQSDFVQDIKGKTTDKIYSMQKGNITRANRNPRPVNKVSLKCPECGGEMVRNGSGLECPFCGSVSYIDESDSVKRAQLKRDAAINRQNKRHELEMLKEKNRREEAKQNSKMSLIILAVFVVLLIILFVLLFSMDDKDKNEESEAANNTGNTVLVETNIENNDIKDAVTIEDIFTDNKASDTDANKQYSIYVTDDIESDETVEYGNEDQNKKSSDELDDLVGLSLKETKKLVRERGYTITYFYSNTGMDATGDVEWIDDDFYLTGRVVEVKNVDANNKTAEIYFIPAQILQDMKDGKYSE